MRVRYKPWAEDYLRTSNLVDMDGAHLWKNVRVVLIRATDLYRNWIWYGAIYNNTI